MDIPAERITERWRYAIEASGDAVWDWNPQTGELYFSEAARVLLGCQDIPLTLDEWMMRVHPDDRQRVDDDVTRMIEGKTPFYINEHRVVQDNGTVRWILDRGKIIDRDASGKPIRVIGIYSDITRLKSAEEQIRLQTLVLDQIADFVTVTDLKGNILYVNKAVERMLGSKFSDLNGESVHEYWEDPEIVAMHGEIGKKTLQDGEWRGELINIDKDGNRILLDCRTRVVLDSSGKPIALCGVSTDITRQRQTQDLLKLSETKYRLLFDFLMDGFGYHEILRDANGKPVNYRFLEINPAFTELTGLSRDQVIGKTVLEALPSLEKAWIDAFGRVADTGVSEIFEQHVKSLNKTYRVAAYRPEINKFACVFQDITQQRKMQEELIRREEEYRRIVETSVEGIWVFDENYISTYANRQMSRILGFPIEELIGKPIPNYFSPDDMPVIEEHLKKRKSGESEVYELRFHRKDGSECWCIVSAVPILQEGVFKGSFAMFTDITQRRNAEEMLKESERKYRILFETMHDGFAMHEVLRDASGKSTDFRFLVVNPSFSRILLHETRVIGKTVKEIFNDMDPAWFNIYRRVADSGTPETFEVYLPQLNRWCRASAFRPEIDKLACLFQDITEQKKAQEELQKRDDEYRRIVETSNEGILCMDVELNATYINHRMSEILGYSMDETLGRSAMDFLFPEDSTSILTHLQKRKSGESEVYEHRFRRKNGSECWCIVSAVPIVEQGVYKGSFAMFTDITDRKNIEAHLMHSQKIEAVGRLAAGVAHDFNNQLTIIQGYCDRLISGMSRDNPMYDSLDQIRKASHRSQSTTRHLLAYSRKQILQPETLDLCEFLREIRTPIASILGEDIRLELLAPGQPLWVTLDRSELHHAIMNLVVNSRDAMPDGGGMDLAACSVVIDKNNLSKYPDGRTGSFIKLCVIDTGFGMDQKTLDRAFDPFFSTKEVGKGTGLGLPMVQGFVSQSQGFMKIQSQPGKGTSVCLYFPEADQPAVVERPAPPETISAPSPAKGALLVVEDEDSVRKLIVTTLQEEGHMVLSASTPSEALEIARKHPDDIDLLISDMIMPEMKGSELSRLIKNIRPGLPVLFITGYVSDVEQMDDEILQKPFRAGELIAAVQRRLRL